MSYAVNDFAADDKPLWDVVFAVHGYPAILLAHKLRIFALLAPKPLSLAAICAALQTAQRPTRAILAAAASLGFLHDEDDSYGLTDLARRYLLEGSPTYFGGQLDLTIANYAMCSLQNMEGRGAQRYSTGVWERQRYVRLPCGPVRVGTQVHSRPTQH